MGTTAQKLTYLNETKTLLKNKINITGANITTDTFRQYPTKLQNALLNCWNNEGEPIFTNWNTKVNGEGTNVKLDNTINARMKITPKGNTTQNGTPTPSSPINVNVVSGDNEVVVCGKNLFDNIYSSGTQNGITYTKNEDKTMLLNGTATANVFMVLNTITLPSGTYILSGCPSGGSTGTYKQDILINGSVVANDIGSGATFTLNATTSIQARIRIQSGTTINNLVFKPMIGVEPTEYEPYTSQNYPLYLGVENLKDYTTDFTKQAGWSTEFAVSMGQIININIAQASSLVWGVLGYDTSAYNGKQMTLSFDIKTSGDNINVYFDTTSTFAYTTNNANSVPISSEYKRVSFTTNSANNCLYTMIKNTTTNTSATIQIRNVMLSVGGACSYTPYGTTPIELCDIGNYVDFPFKAINGDKYFDTLTQAQKDLLTYGKWYLHKAVGKVVLNGSDNEGWAFSGTPGIFYIPTITDYAISGNIPYSNFYTGVDNVNYTSGMIPQNNNTIAFANANATPRFYVKDTRYTNTISDLKTWLSTNNLTVLYALETPTEEEITNTTLINQLEALKGAMSYEGQTNISSGFMIVGASALGELN